MKRARSGSRAGSVSGAGSVSKGTDPRIRIRINTKMSRELERCTSRVLLLVVDSPFTPLVAITSLKDKTASCIKFKSKKC